MQIIVSYFVLIFSNDLLAFFLFIIDTLLLSCKAGGVGFNLVGASRLILYDVDWNPAHDAQAMARIWRDGQKKRVQIYRFLTTVCYIINYLHILRCFTKYFFKGTIEEKMFQRQASKQILSGAVVDAKRKSKCHFSNEELKDLFSCNYETLCLTHDQLNCVCDCGEPPMKVNMRNECFLIS